MRKISHLKIYSNEWLTKTKRTKRKSENESGIWIKGKEYINKHKKFIELGWNKMKLVQWFKEKGDSANSNKTLRQSREKVTCTF